MFLKINERAKCLNTVICMFNIYLAFWMGERGI